MLFQKQIFAVEYITCIFFLINFIFKDSGKTCYKINHMTSYISNVVLLVHKNMITRCISVFNVSKYYDTILDIFIFFCDTYIKAICEKTTKKQRNTIDYGYLEH